MCIVAAGGRLCASHISRYPSRYSRVILRQTMQVLGYLPRLAFLPPKSGHVRVRGLTHPEKRPPLGETENGMNAELDQQVHQLRQMTTAQLQRKYRELFGQASHSNHKNYLFRRVAWRVQALVEGGLSERARQYAREIASDADLRLCAPQPLLGTRPTARIAHASRQLDPRVPAAGTQLIKRYKDQTLTVTVLENGYHYEERLYKSLSAIARQVTGTQWNGYLFFGLGLRKEQSRGE
jgi:hypothetical protein